ncbi:MAG: hypothetical protein ACKO4Z_05095, partial [Planctomycetota bacterium]
DSFIVYQAAIIQPGGVGAVVWDATDYEAHTSPPHGEPVDLKPNFLGYERCPPIVWRCSWPMREHCSSDSWATCDCSAEIR